MKYGEFDVLEDHIQCSICLSAIRGAVLTPCGHRYCYKCISEWIGREHSCPCCKKQLQVDSFYYDVLFDSFVEQILLHRDKAEQEHFDKMFNQVTDLSKESKVSPFQEILRKHLKKSMISVDHYFYKLQQDYQHKIHRLQSGVIPESLSDPSQGIDEITVKLERHLEDSQKLAAEALDRYLTNNIPALEFLPVNVSVYINDKDIRIPNVIFNPTDRITDIKTKIEQAIHYRNDEVTSWTEEGSVILMFSPLAKRDSYNVEELRDTLANRTDINVLSWESQPILQYFMQPGCEIVLHKALKLQADEPLKCYVHLFKERGPHPVDYFSCEDCNSKWICKSCLQGCHAGHRTTPFVLMHTPSWGCCYCPKKKLCKIQNNR